MTPALQVRPATAADAAAVAEVLWTARVAAAPAMPPPVRGRAALEERCAADLGAGPAPGGVEVWVAEDEQGVVGVARFTEVWLDDLYVAPGAQGAGVGALLLNTVKALRPTGFSLWVFASNVPARSFYARHGLVEREHTDGTENEEGAPDLRMEWPGRTTGP